MSRQYKASFWHQYVHTWAHLSIHNSQYLQQFVDLIFVVNATTFEFSFKRIYFFRNPSSSHCLKKRNVATVLFYDLASKNSLMSFIPCSAATVTMWSKAFTWRNIFTISLTCSLLAEEKNVFTAWTPEDYSITWLCLKSQLRTDFFIILKAPPVLFQQM